MVPVVKQADFGINSYQIHWGSIEAVLCCFSEKAQLCQKYLHI